MKEKKHLTKEGLEQIKKIKARMNTGRKISVYTAKNSGSQIIISKKNKEIAIL